MLTRAALTEDSTAGPYRSASNYLHAVISHRDEDDDDDDRLFKKATVFLIFLSSTYTNENDHDIFSVGFKVIFCNVFDLHVNRSTVCRRHLEMSSCHVCNEWS